jgi:signal transduction histidine kinase
MKLSLRNRILAVALLGVLTCAVSLFGLGRILQLTTAVRMERARETAGAELAAMRRATAPFRTSVLGMRGGYVDSGADLAAVSPDLDEATRAGLEETIRKAAQSHEATLREGEGTDTLVAYGAAPTPAGSFAWVVYTVRPPVFLWMWRVLLVSLTVATLLLVGTALGTVVSVRRGVDVLNASLVALAGDLASPVPRPRAAAGVAHEVRNPLASIKLRVDLGRMRPDTPPQLAGELASVSEEITRLDRLVADLLMVAGRRICSRTSTSLGDLVEQRASLLAPWAGERGVRIQPSGKATCPLDADAVARALDNLVRNAVEASPTGEAVEVQVLDDDSSGARVRVLDRGGGVDDARVPELFEPFFTTKPDGTGLGLALSRAIAAAHGGTLTYARKDGVTCFELTFPRAPFSNPGERARPKREARA